jgi:hypothetical protein
MEEAVSLLSMVSKHTHKFKSFALGSLVGCFPNSTLALLPQPRFCDLRPATHGTAAPTSHAESKLVQASFNELG